jgi:hypothetical protein
MTGFAWLHKTLHFSTAVFITVIVLTFIQHLRGLLVLFWVLLLLLRLLGLVLRLLMLLLRLVLLLQQQYTCIL